MNSVCLRFRTKFPFQLKESKYTPFFDYEFNKFANFVSSANNHCLENLDLELWQGDQSSE